MYRMLAVAALGYASNTTPTTNANTATTRMMVRNANHSNMFLPRSPTYSPMMYPMDFPS